MMVPLKCVPVSRAFPDDYDRTLYKAHTEVLFKGLLLHLDDPSPNIQVRKEEGRRKGIFLVMICYV